MSRIEITSLDVGSCRVVETRSGASLTTDLPPEYGGSGLSFSATDLLAAALGVCIATNIDTVADRHGIPLDALAITVDKTLSTNPRRLERLAVQIVCSVELTSGLLERLKRAADHCIVHRSLHPDVIVTVDFVSARSDEAAEAVS
jgi:putative redox protein